MGASKVIKYIFTAVGLLMLIGAFKLYNYTQTFLSEATTTNGEVIELIRERSSSTSSSSNSSDSYTYRPVVQFTTQSGKEIEFTSSTGSNPASYSRGEKVEVLYQLESPEKAKINGFFSLWGAAVIVGGIGAIFFLIGGGMLLFGQRKKQKIQSLMQSGVPITTKYQSVELNSSYEVNGRSPYRILSQWTNPTTSELHIFKSDNIWFDPSDHVSSEEITVLIENNNPKKYHMDISFLPKLAK